MEKIEGEAASVEAVLERLRALASELTLQGYSRSGIPTDKALGVSKSHLQELAGSLGAGSGLAAALWDTGLYEARILATMVAEPATLSPAQMERWAADFDNWAVCDAACFNLFDRSPEAFALVEAWATREEELIKRAAFSLLGSLAQKDLAGEERLRRGLELIEAGAEDPRDCVSKAVSWALRVIGKKSATLHAAAIAVADRLAASPRPSPRWVGKDAFRELYSEMVVRLHSTKKSSPAMKRRG